MTTKDASDHDRTEQADADAQRLFDEQLHIVGYALVRVVGGVALQLHAVVVGAVHPFAEIAAGHPAPPADLKPLIEVELVDGKRDVEACQDGEDAELPDEAVPVAFLKIVVEAAAPLVQQNVDGDQRELDRNHRREQGAAGQFVFGTEIGRGDPPYGGDRRADIVHRCPSPGEMASEAQNCGKVDNIRLKSHMCVICVSLSLPPSRP